jgi:hypothetical protein
MNRSGTEWVRISSLSALVVLLSAGAANAQVVPASGPGAQPAARPAARPETPQVVAFPADGVTLEGAVRMTLAHNPSLRLAESAMHQQRGVAQEESGLFDATLQMMLSFEDRSEESADYQNGTFGLKLPKYFRGGLLVMPYANTNLSSTSADVTLCLGSEGAPTASDCGGDVNSRAAGHRVAALKRDSKAYGRNLPHSSRSWLWKMSGAAALNGNILVSIGSNGRIINSVDACSRGVGNRDFTSLVSAIVL